MTAISRDWEDRAERLWAAFDDVEPAAFRAAMDALVAELPADSAVGRFERAGAFDATDEPESAIPLYREALALGLDDTRHRCAVIQLASSLRNLGQPSEGAELLTAERDRTSGELDDEVTAFLALCLVDAGREREATALALGALAPHLSMYRRSVTHYASELNSRSNDLSVPPAIGYKLTPPSMTRSWPTAKPAPGEVAHSTAEATSLRAPTRPKGRVVRIRSVRCSSVSSPRKDIGVSEGPGLTTLIRIPSPMYSAAAARLSAVTAALLAP